MGVGILVLETLSIGVEKRCVAPGVDCNKNGSGEDILLIEFRAVAKRVNQNKAMQRNRVIVYAHMPRNIPNEI